MTACDSDRPAENEAKRRRFPYIHPEDLGPAERLAIDADAVEDFVEHFEHHKDHVAHSDRARFRAETRRSEADDPDEDSNSAT